VKRTPVTESVNVEYRIDTHGNFLILEDILPLGFASEGSSASGIRVSFGAPVDASGKLVVQRICGFGFAQTAAARRPM